MSEGLDTLAEELEAAAARLRSGDLDPEEAAAIVERCADLAARLGTELDSQSRAAAEAPPSGQERLL